jgi:hypothetical protein
LVHEKSDDALKQAIDASLESYELEERKRKGTSKLKISLLLPFVWFD